MAEHKQGTMDIIAQEKTFNGFIKFLTRGAIAVIVVLILLALIGA